MNNRSPLNDLRRAGARSESIKIDVSQSLVTHPHFFHMTYRYDQDMTAMAADDVRTGRY